MAEKSVAEAKNVAEEKPVTAEIQKQDTPQAKYLKAAYQEAIAYADGLVNRCDELKESYRSGDAFLVKHNAMYIVLMVVQILLGIAGLVVRGMLLEYIDAFAPESWDWGLLENYVSMVIILVCLLLIALGVWRMARMIYAGKRKVDLAEFDRIAAGIRKEKETAGENLGRYIRAFETKEFIRVENPSAWERSYDEFREKAKNMGSTTSTGVQLVSMGISFAALVVFGVIFTPWILTALSGEFEYAKAFILTTAYLVLYELTNLSMLELARYQKKRAKPVMTALFVIFQIIVGILAFSRDAFSPVFGGDNFFTQYILTKGCIFLVLTTMFGVLIQCLTDIDRALEWKEKGCLELSIGGDAVGKIYPIEKYATVLAGVICLFATPFGTAYAFNKGGIFLGTLVYLGIGVVWILMLVLFSTQRLRYAAGRSLAWTRNAFYAAYFFLTISLIPDFGVGTALLVVLQILAPLGVVGLISLTAGLVKKQMEIAASKAPENGDNRGKKTESEAAKEKEAGKGENEGEKKPGAKTGQTSKQVDSRKKA